MRVPLVLRVMRRGVTRNVVGEGETGVVVTGVGSEEYWSTQWIKSKVISEYWGVFIIRYIHNGDECVIEHYVVMGVNMTCGKVQYQREITVISRTITKKDATPGLWLPSGKLLTV